MENECMKCLNDLKSMRTWIPWYFGTDHKKHPTLDGKSWAKWADHIVFMTYNAALSLYNSNPRMDGIGFCVPSGYCVLDLDDVVTPSGKLTEAALSVMGRFKGYTEYSPSHTGVHIIIRAELNGYANKTFNIDGQSVEVKPPGNHYVTFTANPLPDFSGQSQTIPEILPVYTSEIADLYALEDKEKENHKIIPTGPIQPLSTTPHQPNGFGQHNGSIGTKDSFGCKNQPGQLSTR